jgi:hypothetical protein
MRIARSSQPHAIRIIERRPVAVDVIDDATDGQIEALRVRCDDVPRQMGPTDSHEL